MERWANKVALVTGAGDGMGAQIVRDLSAKELIVYGLDFNQVQLDKVTREIHTNNPKARFTPILCDLTKEDEIKAAFDKITDEMGGVDILVNCAGIVTAHSILEEGSDDAILRIIQTNLMAVISCTKKAFKSMSERDVFGHIVNICSVAGVTVLTLPGMKPALGAYSISKFGVNILNRAIGQELVYYKKPKIRISNISPGFVGETGITRGMTEYKEFQENSPQMKPKDIADTVMFILGTPSHVQIRDIIVDVAGAALY